VYSLIQVNREYQTFYRNMLLFVSSGQLLERTTSKGVNPNIEGDPTYFGFSQVGVDRYGYYFLFLVNLPTYAEKMCDPENADYLQSMLVKERRKREKELEAEEEEDSKDDDYHTGDLTQEHIVEDPWKDVKNTHYICATWGN
jgi:hypothetical protein